MIGINLLKTLNCKVNILIHCTEAKFTQPVVLFLCIQCMLRDARWVQLQA